MCLFCCRLGVILTNPPLTIDTGKSLFDKYPEKPDRLPVRYFTDLKSDAFRPIGFSHIHGAELELYCEYRVALRKRSSSDCH
jgi:hypothetical protein